jgi:hypothetical protein
MSLSLSRNSTGTKKRSRTRIYRAEGLAGFQGVFIAKYLGAGLENGITVTRPASAGNHSQYGYREDFPNTATLLFLLVFSGAERRVRHVF